MYPVPYAQYPLVERAAGERTEETSSAKTKRRPKKAATSQRNKKKSLIKKIPNVENP